MPVSSPLPLCFTHAPGLGSGEGYPCGGWRAEGTGWRSRGEWGRPGRWGLLSEHVLSAWEPGHKRASRAALRPGSLSSPLDCFYPRVSRGRAEMGYQRLGVPLREEILSGWEGCRHRSKRL